MNERYTSENFGNDAEIVNHPKALERAQRIIERSRTKIEEFEDLYGSATIESDRAYVEKRTAQFHVNDFRDPDLRVAKEKAEIFEAIIFQEADGAQWFGEDSAIIMPSLYDDIHNHIDSLIEIERQNGLSIAALSLDVTFRKDVGSKLDDIVDKIKKGKLAIAKYYQSELGSIRGEVGGIPHFVVGVNAPTLNELTNLFADGKSASFATHPVQFQIIDSIRIQAATFARLAEEYSHHDVVKAYQRIERIFGEIYDLRNAEVGDKGIRDSFFQNLESDLRRIR